MEDNKVPLEQKGPKQFISEAILLQKATQAMENSYSPYSKFSVGAAVLSKSGALYTGCNIENASYGATICAERVAIFSAVAAGERDFEAIAIVSSAKEATLPCGVCLQVMAEFMVEGIVITADKDSKPLQYRVRDLLPHPFVL